jgi:hypothetical protein
MLLFASTPGAIDATAAGGGALSAAAAVRLQPLELQARFTKLAWAGGRFLAPGEVADTNIAVIGAKVCVGGGLLRW